MDIEKNVDKSKKKIYNETVVTVKKVYAKEGASENCRLVKTPKAHWWCEDIVWNTVKEETEKLGW